MCRSIEDVFYGYSEVILCRFGVLVCICNIIVVMVLFMVNMFLLFDCDL